MASPYKAGDQVLYFSRMSQDWMPTQVSRVSPTGDVELSHKPGLWMSPKEQPALLRPATGMAMQGKGNQLNKEAAAAAAAAPQMPPPQCQGPPNMKGGHPHAAPPAAGGGWQMARPMPPAGKGGAGGMWPGPAPPGKGADPWHGTGKGAGAMPPPDPSKGAAPHGKGADPWHGAGKGAGAMPPPDPNKGAWPRPPPAGGKGAPPPPGGGGGYGVPQPQPSPVPQQHPPPAVGHQGAPVPAAVAAATTDPGRAPVADAMPTACAFAGCEHAAVAAAAPPSPPVYQPQAATAQQQALPTACAFPGGSGSGQAQGGLPPQAAALPTGCAFPAGTLAGGLVVRDPDAESYPGELQQLKQNQWKTMDASEFQQNQKRINQLERRAV